MHSFPRHTCFLHGRVAFVPGCCTKPTMSLLVPPEGCRVMASSPPASLRRTPTTSVHSSSTGLPAHGSHGSPTALTVQSRVFPFLFLPCPSVHKHIQEILTLSSQTLRKLHSLPSLDSKDLLQESFTHRVAVRL